MIKITDGRKNGGSNLRQRLRFNMSFPFSVYLPRAADLITMVAG